MTKEKQKDYDEWWDMVRGFDEDIPISEAVRTEGKSEIDYAYYILSFLLLSPALLLLGIIIGFILRFFSG